MNLKLPNILTILRLSAAPLMAILFLYFNRPLADWFALIVFLLASITDFIDGYLARKWGQTSNFGRMLDPIADKAMVTIALLVIVGLNGLDPWILFAATAIVLREVFVTGLREFLANNASTLHVAPLAKWKTTAQMIAIAVLFSKGVFEHYYLNHIMEMDKSVIAAILSGEIADSTGLKSLKFGYDFSYEIGRGLLVLATLLTLITGYDYFIKSRPFLKE